ncbi:IS5 family transposase [Pararhizobium mangrovi]|uniref:IS5 family transposase n=1 Tax=Pararhizobium mangrovi TaxID=2590452 RepID=A0A506U2Z4_9HYPH|nr:IS5 family transposase [Pararhizobium mangrovi]
MMEDAFWLTEEQFAELAPLLPNDTRGVARVDDRRVISGIVHVLKSGCRWKDAPACYGPRKTLYNRFVRWAAKGVWDDVFLRLAESGGPPAALMIDATIVKAHLSAAGGKGGPHRQAIGRSRCGRSTKIHLAVDEKGRPRRLIVKPGHQGDAPVAGDLVSGFTPVLCLADTAYDSNAFRATLIANGTKPVIPNNPTRKHHHPFDRPAYRLRNVVERTICRLKDWRRIATRYDKLARNFHAAVIIASIVSYWL